MRVAGLGKALRMDLEEVFVRAEEVYQARQRIYNKKKRSVSHRLFALSRSKAYEGEEGGWGHGPPQGQPQGHDPMRYG